MKKLIILLLLTVTFTACDTFRGYHGCGTIVGHGSNVTSQGDDYYYIYINPDNGGATVTQYVNFGTWLKTDVGEYICFD